MQFRQTLALRGKEVVGCQCIRLRHPNNRGATLASLIHATHNLGCCLCNLNTITTVTKDKMIAAVLTFQSCTILSSSIINRCDQPSNPYVEIRLRDISKTLALPNRHRDKNERSIPQLLILSRLVCRNGKQLTQHLGCHILFTYTYLF